MVVFLPSFTYIGAGVSLCIGGAISGWSRKKNGGEFWEGFADYINEKLVTDSSNKHGDSDGDIRYQSGGCGGKKL